MSTPPATLESEPMLAPHTDLAAALEFGVVLLSGRQGPRQADARALELLGCADLPALERRWQQEILPALAAHGVRWPERAARRGATIEIPAGAGRRLRCDLLGDGEGGVLLVSDPEVAAALEADLRLAAQMRSLAQISPAVAHDLRAPINAMVFNIEILKETIASGRGAEPGGRERQLRYVEVLREELARLHRALEIFIAHTSPREDREEVLDLRELAGDLAALLVAPARKQQAQVTSTLPEAGVPVHANRYLLRQALLHLALAALDGVPRGGTLEVRLDGREGPARLRLAATGAAAGGGEAPAADFDLRFSREGTEARLYAAHAILTALGGAVRPAASAGAACGFEIELPVQGHPHEE
jgi:signal transduction histidine kinase